MFSPVRPWPGSFVSFIHISFIHSIHSQKGIILCFYYATYGIVMCTSSSSRRISSMYAHVQCVWKMSEWLRRMATTGWCIFLLLSCFGSDFVVVLYFFYAFYFNLTALCRSIDHFFFCSVRICCALWVWLARSLLWSCASHTAERAHIYCQWPTSIVPASAVGDGDDSVWILCEQRSESQTKQIAVYAWMAYGHTAVAICIPFFFSSCLSLSYFPKPDIRCYIQAFFLCVWFKTICAVCVGKRARAKANAYKDGIFTSKNRSILYYTHEEKSSLSVSPHRPR